MRTLIMAIASAVLCASTGGAISAANIAKIPTGLAQSYGDGTLTKLSCLPGTARLNSCTFHVVSPNGTTTYAIESGDYRLEFYLSQYWYWPGTSSNDFAVAVPVLCSAGDLSRLTQQQRDEASCRLFLSPTAGKLIPTRLEVNDRNGKTAAGLGPNNSFKPKPLRGSA